MIRKHFKIVGYGSKYETHVERQKEKCVVALTRNSDLNPNNLRLAA